MPRKFLRQGTVALVLLILLPLLSGSALLSKASADDLPYTFFMTHYELLGTGSGITMRVNPPLRRWMAQASP